MSAPVRTLTVGDRAPAFAEQLFDTDGITPLDLTGATLLFKMAIQDGVSPVISGVATIVGTPTQGFFSYAWASGDTAVPGLYLAEVVVTKSGISRTLPPAPWPIEIRPDV